MSGSSQTLSPALPAEIEQLALELLKTTTRIGLKIATAESCTGGLLASLLTDVEGCGHCFDRGFVTYTDNAKAELLGVPQSILERDGAVSRRCAEAMVSGALERSQADIAVAITGYAGPGAPGEEPGLVYIAARRRGLSVQASEHHFGNGGRGEVRIHCLRVALESLQQVL
jgi:nicotinamide-nucleotide amidase